MRMRHWIGLIVLGFPALLAAQEGDQAALSIREAGREIGHEDFTIKPGRPGRPVGDSLISYARFPETRPQATVEGVLQQSTRGTPLSISIDYHNGRQGESVLASVGRSRVTVRRVAKGAESARELPGGDSIVLLDDSLFATFLTLAPLAGDSPRSVTAIFPRSARRATLTVTRTSISPVRDDGAKTSIEFSGELNGRLFLDAGGRFVRLELPSRQIEVTRLPK